MRKIIAYYRVSTKRQGKSGLGLDAQREAVQNYAKRRNARIIAVYTEIESGRSNERPELAKAIGHANLIKAKLVVAKLDRLSRNVAFLATLMDTRVNFTACDIPRANRLTIHVLAAVAESEAQAISDRTRKALRAAKRRGVLLGSARPNHWRGREDRRQAGWRKAVKLAAVARTAAAKQAYGFLLPTIQQLRTDGKSLPTIAAKLNHDGHTTRMQKPWTATAVWRVLKAS